MYFTRGYAFHTLSHGQHRSTANYGICVKAADDGLEFYGILQDIIEVEYPGILRLRCVLFKCDWYDPVIGRGVRQNKFGGLDVNISRRYSKFEPFILSSQADQVAFIPYPRLRQTGIPWSAVIKVIARGCIVRGHELPLQQEDCEDISYAEENVDSVYLIDPEYHMVEEMDENNEEDEFEEDETTEDETTEDETLSTDEDE